ncbi:hypothetical protein PR048_009737 [Dryococelus australis]|uniref:C3H1-type domain-containing protein n=1 Tax=Dryococelus australis TaxID=614101 RepID=A0ABQ9I1P5_9NEOP|nr:hypothetical protein PR048_009737 [Dryococelus australis]
MRKLLINKYLWMNMTADDTVTQVSWPTSANLPVHEWPTSSPSPTLPAVCGGQMTSSETKTVASADLGCSCVMHEYELAGLISSHRITMCCQRKQESSPPSALTHSRLHSSVSHPLVHSSNEHLTSRRPVISSHRAHFNSLPHTRQAASAKDCRPLDCGSRHLESSPTRVMRRGGMKRQPVSPEHSSVVAKRIGNSSRREQVSTLLGFTGFPEGGQTAMRASFQEEGRVRSVSDYGAGQLSRRQLQHANGVRFPVRSLPDFRTWVLCRTMPLVSGFSRGSPRFPHPCIPALLQTLIALPFSVLKSPMLTATQTLSTLLNTMRWRDAYKSSRLVDVVWKGESRITRLSQPNPIWRAIIPISLRLAVMWRHVNGPAQDYRGNRPLNLAPLSIGQGCFVDITSVLKTLCQSDKLVTPHSRRKGCFRFIPHAMGCQSRPEKECRFFHNTPASDTTRPTYLRKKTFFVSRSAGMKGRGKTGYPRENPPTNGIVRHDSHMRESRVTRQGIEPGTPWWEASSLTAQPPLLNLIPVDFYLWGLLKAPVNGTDVDNADDLWQAGGGGGGSAREPRLGTRQRVQSRRTVRDTEGAQPPRCRRRDPGSTQVGAKPGVQLYRPRGGRGTVTRHPAAVRALLPTDKSSAFLGGRDGPVVKLLASHLGGAPGFSHVGIVPGVTAGRRVSSGDLPFPPPLHFSATPSSPHFVLMDSQYHDVKSRPDLLTHSLVPPSLSPCPLTSHERQTLPSSSSRIDTKFECPRSWLHANEVELYGRRTTPLSPRPSDSDEPCDRTYPNTLLTAHVLVLLPNRLHSEWFLPRLVSHRRSELTPAPVSCPPANFPEVYVTIPAAVDARGPSCIPQQPGSAAGSLPCLVVCEVVCTPPEVRIRHSQCPNWTPFLPEYVQGQYFLRGCLTFLPKSRCSSVGREPDSGAAVAQWVEYPIVEPHSSAGREPYSGAAVAQWVEHPIVGPRAKQQCNDNIRHVSHVRKSGRPLRETNLVRLDVAAPGLAADLAPGQSPTTPMTIIAAQSTLRAPPRVLIDVMRCDWLPLCTRGGVCFLCPVAPSWFETRSEIESKIDTENCYTIRVQSWTGDRDEVHFEPPKLTIRNLNPRSATIVDKLGLANQNTERAKSSSRNELFAELNVESSVRSDSDRDLLELTGANLFLPGLRPFRLGSQCSRKGKYAVLAINFPSECSRTRSAPSTPSASHSPTPFPPRGTARDYQGPESTQSSSKPAKRDVFLVFTAV